MCQTSNGETTGEWLLNISNDFFLCVCMHTHTHARTCTCRSKVNLGVLRYCPSWYFCLFLSQGFLLAQGLLIELDLVASEPQRFSFLYGFQDGTQVLMLM